MDECFGLDEGKRKTSNCKLYLKCTTWMEYVLYILLSLEFRHVEQRLVYLSTD